MGSVLGEGAEFWAYGENCLILGTTSEVALLRGEGLGGDISIGIRSRRWERTGRGGYITVYCRATENSHVGMGIPV